MNTSTYVNLIRATVLIGILFSNSLFAEDHYNFVKTDYETLCGIYKDIISKPVDLTSKEMELTESVQSKLPQLFNQLFIHIIKANADRRYQLIKQYAKQQSKVNWECDIAHNYYSSEFGKP